jgi:hypothetical protein
MEKEKPLPNKESTQSRSKADLPEKDILVSQALLSLFPSSLTFVDLHSR